MFPGYVQGLAGLFIGLGEILGMYEPYSQAHTELLHIIDVVIESSHLQFGEFVGVLCF